MILIANNIVSTPYPIGTTSNHGASTDNYNTQGFYNTAGNWFNNTAWDFTNIWQWGANNLPVLRGFKAGQGHTVQ